MPVGAMLRSMSGREFVEWMAFYQLEPWGEERADLRQAFTTKMLYDVNRDPKKSKDLPVTTWMPYTEQPEREHNPEQLRAKWTQIIGGKA